MAHRGFFCLHAFLGVPLPTTLIHFQLHHHGACTQPFFQSRRLPKWTLSSNLFFPTPFSELRIAWTSAFPDNSHTGPVKNGDAFERLVLEPTYTRVLCCLVNSHGDTANKRCRAGGGTCVEPLSVELLPWPWCNPQATAHQMWHSTFISLELLGGITWLHGWALLPLPCYAASWAAKKFS